mgnify:CR=1 FL=1
MNFSELLILFLDLYKNIYRDLTLRCECGYVLTNIWGFIVIIDLIPIILCTLTCIAFLDHLGM